ncbi:MAG: hypothetical protein QM817_39780 [Archangium sp.]
MRTFLSIGLFITGCSPATFVSVSASKSSARVGDTVVISAATPKSDVVTFTSSSGMLRPSSVTPTNGLATANLTVTMPGEVTVTATQGTTSDSTTVTFTAGPTLRFQTSPGNSASQNLLRPIPVVVIEEDGNVVTSSTASVTVAVTPGSCNAQLDATSLATVNAQMGAASFNGLKITTPVNGCSLTATSGSLPAAVSSTFNITP